MAASVQPEKILHELAGLWAGMAQPGQGDATASGVLRACAMTLIVAAESTEDAASVSETIGELMHEHPSRAIVLKPSAGGELSARVFAQCWMPFGRRQQVCCEQIEISAGSDRLDEVPRLMLGLLAPDLPVVLWCRGERWFSQPHFAQLLPLVDKLIVDSSSFADSGAALNLIGELIWDGHRVADLAWGRLTGWREIIAQRFDTPPELADVSKIHNIRIRRAGPKCKPEAYYLAAWLQRAIPNAQVAIEESGGDDGIRGVDLEWITFERTDSNTVELREREMVHRSALPSRDDCSVMREELSITRRDGAFEKAHPIAAGLLRKH